MTINDRNVHHGRTSVLFAVCLAALVLPLSFSGPAMATLAIGRDIGGSPTALNWITNAFMLTFGSTLMSAGALADEYGRKRVFLSGTTLFAVVSLAIGLSPNILVLDILRAVQGLAAAGALAGGTAALAQEFEGKAQTRAFSLIGTTFGLGLAFGPLLSGFLVETFGWRSIFLSATVVGALSVIIAVPRMTETRDPEASGFDTGGAVTFTAMLSLLTFALIQAPESGWASTVVVGALVGTVVFLVAFVVVENAQRRPLLDFSLFKYVRFIGVQVLPISTCYCYVVLLVLLPLRFIGIEGYSEIGAGVLMISLSAPMLFMPMIAASLAHKVSPGLLSGLGLVIAAAGLFWLSTVEVGTGQLAIALPLFVMGIGTGLPWGLMDGLSVAVVPKERAGMATGIFSTTRVAGEGIALAMVSAILALHVYGELGRQLSDVTASGEASLATAAQSIATGNMSQAMSLLPALHKATLTSVYVSAFDSLLYILIGITLVSAAVVFGFLGSSTPAPEADASEAPAE